MQSKLDPFHAQIVIQYLKNKSDFLNIIQVKKQFRFLLDRLRINPIKITNETKNLFQCLDTQQLFGKYEYDEEDDDFIDNDPNIDYHKQIPNENEILLPNMKRIQYNYSMEYSQMKEIEKTTPIEIDLKFKRVIYTIDDRKLYGNEIPNEVNIIDKYCFRECDFTSFVIPSTVTELRECCFYGCEKLEDIVIPDSVIAIEGCCFYECSSLTRIYLSTNIKEIDYDLFNGCKQLKNISLPPYLTFINNSGLINCGIEEAIFPSTLKRLWHAPFKKCVNLIKVDISNATKLTSLCSQAFNGCSNLKEVTLSDSLQKIDYQCFKNCSSLELINIPSSVSEIQTEAFKNCEKLKEFVILNELCILGENVLDGCTSLTKIQLPTLNGYIKYSPTNEEYKILKKNGLKVISKSNKMIKRKDLQSVELIDNEKFLYFTVSNESKHIYTSMYIPSTITHFDYYSLSYYPLLKEIILPPNISSFGKIDFDGHPQKNIKHIKFSNERTTIDHKMEYFDYLLLKKNNINCTNVYIPQNQIIKQLPTDCNISIDNWFDTNVKFMEIPSNITSIGTWNFLYESITSLTIPSTLKSIHWRLNESF